MYGYYARIYENYLNMWQIVS